MSSPWLRPLAATICAAAMLFPAAQLHAEELSTGVHSVIEPAIMGIAVLFGPVHKNSFEALELIKSGAAIEVNNASEIYESLNSLLTDDPKRKQLGQYARAFVESQLGATGRCMEAIENYL